MPKAYVIGVGPGDAMWLTERAKQIIARCDSILSWELNLTPIKNLLAGKHIYLQRPEDYDTVAKAAAEEVKARNGDIGIVRIGDSLVSSGLTGLLVLFKGFETEVVPGISSIQLAAARAQINLDESAVVSFHEERDWEKERHYMFDSFRCGRHLVVLTGPKQPPNETANYLITKGVDSQTQVLVCDSLTLPQERIVHSTLGQITQQKFHWLSILVVINPQGINPVWQTRLRKESFKIKRKVAL